MIRVLRLALRDMAREPVHVFCIVALVAGVLAPLLLLLSVKQGVMDGLVGALRDDPNNRRVDIVGTHAFGPEELAEIRSWPEASFVVEEERSIARRIQARPPGARAFERVSLVGSAAGDPLLPPGVALGPLEIAASATLAERFGLSPGDVLDAVATRGQPPTARLGVRLTVAHVLPRGWLDGTAALASTGFLSTVEAFYDDYALPDLGVAEGRDAALRPIRYESFRVFARDIRDVAALEARLERRLAVTVASRVGQIEPLLRLDRDLGRALDVLTACAAIGLAAALAALFWSSVDRKRLTLSMLALMGTPPWQLGLFPLAQAAMFATAGAAGASAVFLGGVAAFRAVFADDVAAAGGGIAPVDPALLGWAYLGLLSLALAAAAAAAVRAAGTDPATVIRAGGS